MSGIAHLWRHYDLIVQIVNDGTESPVPAALKYLASLRMPLQPAAQNPAAAAAAAAEVGRLGGISHYLLVVPHLLTVGYGLNLLWFVLLSLGLRRVLGRKRVVIKGE